MDNVIPFEVSGPRIPIDLDRRRYLRLNNRALAAAEVELGELWNARVNILTVLADPGGLSLNAIAVLLWCGLRQDDPRLTLEQVLEMIDLLRLAEVTQAIYATWNAAAAAAEPREASEQADPLQVPSPGDDSGALPASNSALVLTNSGT